MSFWSTTSAAPTLWMALGFSRREPHFLRIESPEPPNTSYVPVRATMAHASDIARFWGQYYEGADWYMDAPDSWIHTYLSDNSVYVLMLTDIIDGKREVIATIVSTPFTTHSTYTTMSHGARLQNVRVIEGLCVHPRFRKHGIAGIMIGYIDYYTARLSTGPSVLLWSREIPYVLPISTALQISTYAYIHCSDAKRSATLRPLRAPCVPMPWTNFQTFWRQHVTVANSQSPTILSEDPLHRRGDIDVWSTESAGGIRQIAVIANTRRRMKQTDLPIYEVVWCNKIHHVALCFKQFLLSVAARYTGVLFATSALTGGGADASWNSDSDSPWRYGFSGSHAWYIYNYMPPSFGSCELQAIREEI